MSNKTCIPSVDRTSAMARKAGLHSSDHLEGASVLGKDILANEQVVQFVTEDKYVIQGTYFSAEVAEENAYAVVFNSGAGVAAKRYRHFARFLAASGIPVLTYDFRGIGLSKPSTLRRFPATIEDWAEFDCAAAIDWLRSQCKPAQLIGVGHSVGSMLFGGAPNSEKLAKLVMIGAHTGFFGDYRRAYRLPMALLWHGVMPALTNVFGFFPGQMLRLGDDIPKGVAMQWARRRTPIFRSSVATSQSDRMQHFFERCSQTQIDTLMLTFTDDGFATKAGAARVREYFPKLIVEQWLISPSQMGLKRIGHFGFFRREAHSSLWPPVLQYLTKVPGTAEIPSVS